MFNFFKKMIIFLLIIVLNIVVFFAIVYWIKPKWVNSNSCSKHILAKTQLIFFKKSLEYYYRENNDYPTTQQGLMELLNISKNGKPYIKFVKKDPWQEHFYYNCPGTHNKNSFDLWTYGADKKPGGVDENTDICNW